MSADSFPNDPNVVRQFTQKSASRRAAMVPIVSSLVILCLLAGVASATTGVPIKFETYDGGNADLETAAGVLTNSVTLPDSNGGSLTMTISIIDPTPGGKNMQVYSSGTAGLGVLRSGVTSDNPTQLDTGEVFEITFDQDVWVSEIEVQNFRFAKDGRPENQNDEMDLTIGGETQHYVATTNYTGGISYEEVDLALFSSLSLNAGDSILIVPTAAGELSLDGISHFRLHSISVAKHFIPEPSSMWLLGMGLIVSINKLRRRQR